MENWKWVFEEMEKKKKKKPEGVEDLQGICGKRMEKEGSRCGRSWNSPVWD
jgi:hypothetical protein